MNPYIYIGIFELPVYAVIVTVSFIAGLLICSSISRLYGIQARYVICSGTFAAAGMLAGAKLIYCLTKLPAFIADYNEIYSAYTAAGTAEFLFGGYVFYGGLAGAVLGVIIFCRIFGFDFASMVSILTPLIPFAHGFGRIGCFFGGCCYGIEYYGPLAVQFPYNPFSPSLNDVPRFPVQLLESCFNFGLFAFLFIYIKKKQPPRGLAFGIYLICYSIARFLLEFLRGDNIRGFILGLSTSQWISVILLPAGVAVCMRCTRKGTGMEET